MKPSPYPNYCKKAVVDSTAFIFLTAKVTKDILYTILQHFKSSQNVFFLDKFRAYRAIFTVIENHSFFLTQSLILNTHYLR